MKRSLMILVIAALTAACSLRTILLSSKVPVGSPEEPDAAVLCAALSGVGKWDSAWDARKVIVFADTPSPPEFPMSKTQVALEAAHDERFKPFEQPAEGQDLEVAGGPVIPSTLIASARLRSRMLNVLPTPACDRFVVADGLRLKQLFDHDPPRGWRKFRSAFPEASDMLWCSAPGYSESHTEAIVSCSFTRGALNGVGVFVTLSKEGTEWRVTWSQSLWVS